MVKIKKDKLNIIYWTIAVITLCILTLTNADAFQVIGLALSLVLLIEGLFDSTFMKKHF